MSGWWLLRCPLWGVLGRVGYVNWEQPFSSVCHHGLFKKNQSYTSQCSIYTISLTGKSTFVRFPIFFRVVRTVGDVGAQGAGKNHSISGVHPDFPASDFLEQQFLGHVFLGEPIFTKHNGMRNANRLIQMVYEKRDVARCHATRCHFYIFLCMQIMVLLWWIYPWIYIDSFLSCWWQWHTQFCTVNRCI